MADDVVRGFRECGLSFTWDTEKKAWLVEALSVRDGRCRPIAQCWIIGTDPLPDDQLKLLMFAVVDYWHAVPRE